MGRQSTNSASPIPELRRPNRPRRGLRVKLLLPLVMTAIAAAAARHQSYAQDPVNRADGTTQAEAGQTESGPVQDELVHAYQRGQRYYQQGRYRFALPFWKKALEIGRARYGTENATYAALLSNLATLHKALGDYKNADPLLTEALGINVRILDPDDRAIANSLFALADLYRRQKRYAEAEPLYDRALAMYQRGTELPDPAAAGVLNSLADIYKAQGRFAESESLYERALAVLRESNGDNELAIARILNNLGSLHDAQANHQTAIDFFQQSLEIKRRLLDDKDPSLATSLNNIAVAYQAQGELRKAAQLFAQALEIRLETLGDQHLDVAQSRNNLGAVYLETRDADAAEPLLGAALATRERILGPGHVDVAHSLANLGAVHNAHDQAAEAEPLLERALAIFESQLPWNHPALSRALSNLGACYLAQDRAAEAVPLLIRDLVIRERLFGPDDPRLVGTLNSLSQAYVALGRGSDAVDLRTRLARIQGTIRVAANLGGDSNIEHEPSPPDDAASTGSAQSSLAALAPDETLDYAAATNGVGVTTSESTVPTPVIHATRESMDEPAPHQRLGNVVAVAFGDATPPPLRVGLAITPIGLQEPSTPPSPKRSVAAMLDIGALLRAPQQHRAPTPSPTEPRYTSPDPLLQGPAPQEPLGRVAVPDQPASLFHPIQPTLVALPTPPERLEPSQLNSAVPAMVGFVLSEPPVGRRPQHRNRSDDQAALATMRPQPAPRQVNVAMAAATSPPAIAGVDRHLAEPLEPAELSAARYALSWPPLYQPEWADSATTVGTGTTIDVMPPVALAAAGELMPPAIPARHTNGATRLARAATRSIQVGQTTVTDLEGMEQSTALLSAEPGEQTATTEPRYMTWPSRTVVAIADPEPILPQEPLPPRANADRDARAIDTPVPLRGTTHQGTAPVPSLEEPQPPRSSRFLARNVGATDDTRQASQQPRLGNEQAGPMRNGARNHTSGVVNGTAHAARAAAHQTTQAAATGQRFVDRDVPASPTAPRDVRPNRENGAVQINNTEPRSNVASAETAYLIQLAALSSAESAAESWDSILSAHGDVLIGRAPIFEDVARDDGTTIYRLRTGLFTDFDEAAQLCATLKARGQGCLVVTTNVRP